MVSVDRIGVWRCSLCGWPRCGADAQAARTAAGAGAECRRSCRVVSPWSGATPGALPLSLDDAIARGEKHNLQMLLIIQNERMVHGEVLTVKNNLLPSLTAKGELCGAAD